MKVNDDVQATLNKGDWSARDSRVNSTVVPRWGQRPEIFTN